MNVGISPERHGDEVTRDFYDREGWQEVGDNSTVDRELFGAKDPGAIQIALYELMVKRLRAIVRRAGPRPKVVECGCGANPDGVLLEAARHYTGVDFSSRGLGVAEKKLAKSDVPHELVQSDICSTPFADGTFDVAYSAHVLYHISDPEAQAAAIREMVRIVRPGGLVILILANSRPILFPLQLLKRLIADTPGLSRLAFKMRRTPPLPFKPMKIGWTMRILRPFGKAEVTGFSMASNSFMRSVSENNLLGRALWRGMQICTVNYPTASAYFGNYVMYTLVKKN